LGSLAYDLHSGERRDILGHEEMRDDRRGGRLPRRGVRRSRRRSKSLRKERRERLPGFHDRLRLAVSRPLISYPFEGDFPVPPGRPGPSPEHVSGPAGPLPNFLAPPAELPKIDDQGSAADPAAEPGQHGPRGVISSLVRAMGLGDPGDLFCPGTRGWAVGGDVRDSARFPPW